jgi:hypothetical protein
MTYVKMLWKERKIKALIVDRIIETRLTSLPTGRLKLRAALLGHSGAMDLFLALYHKPEVPRLNVCRKLDVLTRTSCCFYGSVLRIGQGAFVTFAQSYPFYHI